MKLILMKQKLTKYKIIRFSSSISLIFILFTCVEKEFDPSDPQKSFGIAKEPYEDRNYEQALKRLGEFKSRFPYSQFAVEAELLIANSHYELDHYAEAAASYEQFVKLHPNHAQLDFAMYRVGDCYWKEAPDAPDREQEYTEKAVSEWEKLVAKLPESSYAKTARPLLEEGKKRIGESYLFVAEFYCKQEIYHACAYRYLKLIDKFNSLLELKKKAVDGAKFALLKVAEEKKKDPESDKNLYFKNHTADEIVEMARGL